MNHHIETYYYECNYECTSCGSVTNIEPSHDNDLDNCCNEPNWIELDEPILIEVEDI